MGYEFKTIEEVEVADSNAVVDMVGLVMSAGMSTSVALRNGGDSEEGGDAGGPLGQAAGAHHVGRALHDRWGPAPGQHDGAMLSHDQIYGLDTRCFFALCCWLTTKKPSQMVT